MRPRVLISLFSSAAALLLSVTWLLRAQLTEDDARLNAVSEIVVMIDAGGTYGAGIVFAVEDDYIWIVTMKHVARDGDTPRKNPQVRFRQRRLRTYPADHHESFTDDLAVIRVAAAAAPGLKFDLRHLGDPATLRKGENIYAVGYPGGNQWGTTYKPGALGDRKSQWLELQSRDIEAGHSGGAIIDERRRLIGLANERGGTRSQAFRIDSAITVLRDDFKLPVQLTPPEAAASLPPLPQPQQPSEPAAGASRTNPKDGQVYRWIPKGSFRMGCSENPKDGACSPDEKPTHTVRFEKGFWMGQTEVTQEAYSRLTGKPNPSSFKGPKRPVESVNWEEASAFCSAAGMRLPTEAEWEYAARAGTTGAAYGELEKVAWFGKGLSGSTQDTGRLPANAWGLHDMLGNVWEWASDWYDEAYYAKSPAVAPQGSGSGQYRVLRGGSWLDDSSGVRVSFRGRDVPADRSSVIGFRCAGELR